MKTHSPKTQKRIERLEELYFPNSKRRGFYLFELQFLCAYHSKYEGHEDAAPEILRRAYELLRQRPRR